MRKRKEPLIKKMNLFNFYLKVVFDNILSGVVFMVIFDCSVIHIDTVQGGIQV